jgi:phage FluMu protein Com
MPNIRCVKCGQEILIDTFSTPYEAEVACPNCETAMQVYVGSLGQGAMVKRKYPSFEELKEIWGRLSEIEKTSILEASLSLGSGAYTASELMSLRTLEGILRRIYEVNETLGKLIEKMEKDDRLSDLKGILSYFKDVRNRVAHPEKLSSELDAASTFQMTKRLLIEIIKRGGQ